MCSSSLLLFPLLFLWNEEMSCVAQKANNGRKISKNAENRTQSKKQWYCWHARECRHERLIGSDGLVACFSFFLWLICYVQNQRQGVLVDRHGFFYVFFWYGYVLDIFLSICCQSTRGCQGMGIAECPMQDEDCVHYWTNIKTHKR